jgi:hypothetical protein
MLALAQAGQQASRNRLRPATTLPLSTVGAVKRLPLAAVG